MKGGGGKVENEEKIVGMLKQIMEKLDEHSGILGEHSRILGEHSQILGEHSQMLSALRTGQEYLKAEIECMKNSNAKEFGSMKSGMDNFKIDIKILKDQSWENKADIERIKNTMGMS